MTNPYKYKSISLKIGTIEKIKSLSETLVNGTKLSSARTVEKLVTATLSENNHKVMIDAKPQSKL